MHPLFVTPLHFPRTSTIISTIGNRSKQRLVASVSSPSNRQQLLSPPALAQTARVVMSSIQLSTFLSPALVTPLYTSDIVAFLSSKLPVIQALGFANISTAVIFHAHRSLTRLCRIANTVTFAVTAALYLISHIKPAYINLPLAGTLALIAILNDRSIPRTSTPNKSQEWRPASLAKLSAAVCALSNAIFASEMLSRVYLLQIALNLAGASVVTTNGQRMQPFVGFADALMLAGMSACLVSQGTVTVAIFAVAALFAGWEAFLKSET